MQYQHPGYHSSSKLICHNLDVVNPIAIQSLRTLILHVLETQQSLRLGKMDGCKATLEVVDQLGHSLQEWRHYSCSSFLLMRCGEDSPYDEFPCNRTTIFDAT